MTKSRWKQKIFISVYIFILIFAPPIIPQINLVESFLTMIWLVINYKDKIVIHLKKSKAFLFLGSIGGFFLYIIFSLCMNLAFGQDIVELNHYKSLYNRFLVAIITLLPCCLYVNIYCQKRKLSIEDFWEILFYAGLIEALLCVLAFLVPSIKQEFVSIMNRGNDSVNIWYVTVRSFGFARTLVDVFGWGTGILSGLAFMYGVFYKRKYIAFSLFLLISPLLNARTGLVFYALSVLLVVWHLVKERNIKQVFRLSMVILGCVFLFMYFWEILTENYKSTAGWIEKGLNDILLIIKGKAERKEGFGYYFLNDEWWEFPKGLQLLFGSGHSRYGTEKYGHTDFGYVNDIWAGGIIGIGILYGGIYQLFKDSLRFYRGPLNLMLFYVFISIFIFNIKACAVGYNTGFGVAILVIFFMNYYKSSNAKLIFKLRKRRYE